MSKQVDERVVSMQFDNSHFEKNVSQSMSTLEKFKQSLKFNGATKGLEDINTAAGKVNMSGLGNSVETVKAKFSAMEVVAVTALANITNSAVNAAKNMVSSLTIAPISDGFKEYELTLNAIQTTMAGTGKTAEEVEKELKKLDEYADKTVYSTADMLNNLPKFTNAGVELETATKAMIGIANATAHAGGDAGKASIAFYNLGQAIGTGYLTRMDYNSINNAGIATMEWKEAMVEAAIAQGTLTKVGEDSYKVGNKTMTLQQLFIDGLQEQWASTEVMLKVFGDYGDETTEIGKKAYSSAQDIKTFTMMMESLKATAGTGWKDTWQLIFGGLDEAKEFWTGLNKVISGMIEGFADFRNGILEGALGKSFKTLMEPIKGLKKGFENVTEPIKKVTKTLKDYNKVAQEVIYGDWGDGQERWDALTKAGYDWASVQNIVNECLGDSTRHQTDYVIAQDDATKSTEKATEADAKYIAKLAEMSEAELKALGLTDKQIKALKEIKTQADKLGLSVEDFINNIDEIDGRWVLINTFKNAWAGLVKVFESVKNAWQSVFPPKSMEERAQKLYDIIAAVHKFSTHLKMSDDTAEKLTRTFKGLFAVLSIVKTVVGGGISVAFKIISQILSYFNLDILDVTAAIGDAIVAFQQWFDSIFDITWILDIAVPLIQKTVGAVSDWFKEFKQSEGIQKVSKYISELADNVKNWWASLKDSENLPKTIADGIVHAFSSIPKILSTIFSNIWSGIRESFGGVDNNPLGDFAANIKKALSVSVETVKELGKMLLKQIDKFLSKHGFKKISTDSIAGLVNGLKDGAKEAWNAAVNMVQTLVEKVKEFLGIHSPSTVFAAIGGFIIAGLVMGLQNGIPDSLAAIKNVFQPMIDWVKSIDFGSVLASIVTVGTAITAYKAVDAIQSLTAPLKGMKEIFESAAYVMKKSAKSISKVIANSAKVIKGFSKILSAVAFDIRADAIKTLATSLLMLVGAIVILTFFDTKELWNAVGLVAALAAILVALSVAMNLINKSAVDIGKEGISVKSMGTGLIAISAAILLLAIAVKVLGNLDTKQATQGFLGLAGVVGAIAVVIAAFGKFVKGKASDNVDKFGKTMTKLGIALLLMAVVVKILGKMDVGVLTQGTVAILAFSGIMIGLMAATKLISGSKNIDTIGSTLMKIAIAIGVMGFVARLLGGMDPKTLVQGGLAIVAFSGIMVGLMYATKLINGCKNVDTIGGTLLKISIAIGAMGLVARLLGGMDPAELVQGGLAIVAFGGIITGLMYVTKLVSGSKNVGKIGVSILAVSGAIAIMAGTAFLLSMISWEGFAKGTVMIAAFGAIVIGLMAATKLINGSKNVDKIGKTLLMVSGAIAILAGVAVLLGLVPIENLAKGTIVVAIMSGLVMGLIAVSKNAKDCMKELIVLTAMIAIMAGAIYLISTLDAESALSSTLALGGLMVAMTIVLKALKTIGNDWKSAVKGVAALTAMALPLFLFAAILAQMEDVDTSLKTVIALSALMAAMTVLVGLLSAMDVKVGKSIKGIIALTAMALPLTAFVLVLALASGIDDATKNAKALAELAGACTLMLIPLSIIGALVAASGGTGALAIVAGVMALTAMAVPLLVFVGVLAVMSGIKNAESNAKLLTDLMTTMVDLLVKLAIVGPLATVGVAAMTGLTLLIGAIGIMATAIGGLMELCPSLEDFLDKGLSVLEKIAEGLGTMIGKFIGSIGETLGDSLVKIGEDIAEFIETIAAASETAGTINGESFDGIEKLMGVLIKIGGTSIATGFMDKLSMIFNFGDDSMETFEKNGVAFFKAMKSIGEASSDVDIDSEAMDAIIGAAESLVKLQTSIEPIGGVIDFFTGRDDLGTFGVNAAAFIKSMTTAFSSLEDADLNTEAMDAIISAATSLANLQKSIDPIGGVIDFFTGRDDLGSFGVNVASFIFSMKLAFNSLDDAEFNTEAMDAIVVAATSLAKLQEHIGNIGGIITFFTGRDDLGTFGINAAAFIYSMKIALNSLEDADFNTEAMDSIVTASTSLAKLQESIEPIGGVIDWFTGRDDLGTFGTNVASFIFSMKLAFNSLDDADFNTYAMEEIVSAATSLAKLQEHLGGIGGVVTWFTGRDDLGTFGVNVASFIFSMKTAFNSLEDADFNTYAMEEIVSAAISLAKLQEHLGGIGGVVTWFTGRDDLGTFGTNVASFIFSMKLAFNSLKDAEFNTEAMDAIVVAATSLGKIQSSLEPIGGVVEWFNGRGDLGTFGTSVASFISSMKTAYSQLDGVTFNTEAMDAIVVAATGLSKLQSCTGGMADVIAWFTGREGLETFGSKIDAFVGSMKTAYSQLDGVEFNTAAMESVIAAANSLASLQANLEPIGGVIQWFNGQSDLGDFSTKIGQFAEAMKKLREGMGESGISEAVVTSITNAGNAIIALQKALPEEHIFDGKINLTDFSNYITDFADAMATFSAKAAEIDSGAVDRSIGIAYKIKSLIESLSDFDMSGVQAFTGIGTGGFGADGPAYKVAKAMTAYSDEVSGINVEAVSVSVSAARTLRTLINSLSGLDSSGVESFKPETIGSKMKAYANNVAGIDTSIVSSSISAANRLKNFISSLAGLDSSGVANFKPGSIGTAIKSYAGSVSGINTQAVSNSISAATKLRNFISSLAGLNTSGVSSFKKAVNELSTVNISGMVKAFSGASTKLATAGAKMIEGLAKGMLSKKSSVERAATSISSAASDKIESKISGFTKAGKSMATKLAEGFKSNSKSLKTAASSCADDAKDAIRNKYDSFYSAGSYLATGFSKGISADSYKGAAKAKAMAEAAVKEARKALKINSPSKVFKEIGSGIPEGFAMGIEMLGGSVNESVSTMTSSAIDSARSSMSVILDALSSDMDAQPTIRPVVDLSNVKTGANAISGLFAGTQSVGVQTNLSAINVAMNRKLQNGANDDVISAINKLNDGLEASRGDTYNFGNFTYSNNDEINEAVQTLVRAAQMGRRV